jgi:pseudouridine-5'-phosphate glycosidase
MQHILLSPAVKTALKNNEGVVALESTLITHGLPQPTNLETAAAMEDAVRAEGALPATICMFDGKFKVGLNESELRALAESRNPIKISRKDIAYAISKGADGGTTVSGTMEVAHAAGIRVFATGGIGGVHRGNFADTSADLPTLAQIPMIVVCSGAKAILDMPATKEKLETYGVPVLGYQTDELPAFYSIHSGIAVDRRVDSPEEIAAIARAQWNFGLRSAILVTVPVPAEEEIPAQEVDQAILDALREADKNGIHGPATTPFLLEKVAAITKGRSMAANLALLKNNAKIAGKIAAALALAEDR